MINLEIREFSNAIIKFIDQSPLPVEIKRLCINDIAAQLQTAADSQIRTEILERDKVEQNKLTEDNVSEATEQEEEHELIETSSEYPVEK